jgi:hypothetical protein
MFTGGVVLKVSFALGIMPYICFYYVQNQSDGIEVVEINQITRWLTIITFSSRNQLTSIIYIELYLVVHFIRV